VVVPIEVVFVHETLGVPPTEGEIPVCRLGGAVTPDWATANAGRRKQAMDEERMMEINQRTNECGV